MGGVVFGFVNRLVARAIAASAVAGFLGASIAPAFAGETVTYGYDAKGRLVRVEKANGPNNGISTTYGHDRANNRTVVRTTGASR